MCYVAENQYREVQIILHKNIMKTEFKFSPRSIPYHQRQKVPKHKRYIHKQEGTKRMISCIDPIQVKQREQTGTPAAVKKPKSHSEGDSCNIVPQFVQNMFNTLKSFGQVSIEKCGQIIEDQEDCLPDTDRDFEKVYSSLRRNTEIL